MSKLLDDAKAAGFEIINGHIFAGKNVINEKLAKFAALQIPDGYELVKNEYSKNENLEIPTLEQMREIFAQYPNKNMQTITFDADLYKLMPIEPTKEMISQAEFVMTEKFFNCASVYKSMLAASPPTNTKEK